MGGGQGARRAQGPPTRLRPPLRPHPRPPTDFRAAACDAWGPHRAPVDRRRRSPPTPDDHPHIPLNWGRALPPHLAHPYGCSPGPRPLPSTTGTPYPRPRPRNPSPPTTKGRGKGLRREAWRQAGRGHDRDERARELDKTAAGGVERGDWEQAPRLGGRGEAPGDRAAGPAQRTTDDRPRQTGPGPAAGGDGQARGPAGSHNPSGNTALETRPEDPRCAVGGRGEGSCGRRHGQRRVE